MSMSEAMKKFLKDHTIATDDVSKTEIVSGKRVLVPDNVKRQKLHRVSRRVPVQKRKMRRSPQKITTKVMSSHRIQQAHQRAIESERAMHQNQKPQVEKITLKPNTFTQKSNADVSLEVCRKVNERFDTPPCPHYLRECNLCGELTFCAHHGCRDCKLKAKDDTQALTTAPDEEREMLLDIAKREATPKPQSNTETKRPKKYVPRDVYDDILAENKR